MRTNRTDPYAKLLVLTGDSGDDLVVAQHRVWCFRHGEMFQGEAASMSTAKTIKIPCRRQPDDAPRWLSNRSHYEPSGDITQTGDLQGDGSVPVAVYMRLPPDIFSSEPPNLSYHISYRYNGIPLANESSLQVYVNTGYVSSTPLPHTEKGDRRDRRPWCRCRGTTCGRSPTRIMHKFIFQIAKKGKCQDTAPLNLQGAILKELLFGYLGEFPTGSCCRTWRFLPTPGYPFTPHGRSLAETAVVSAG